MAAQNTDAGLQLDDEPLVSYWLEEARNRGADGQWTRTAENLVMYARGDFDGLLRQVDQLLESLPGERTLLLYRSAALIDMGELDAAKETLQLALSSSGYEPGQDLMGNELLTAVQLANIFDITGNIENRDLLLSEILKLVKQLRRDEPPNTILVLISASVASIQNDLPGMLRELESAVAHGFRSHWELIRNPVFTRWQDNEEFKAFHQGMLKAAADMLHECKANNPVEVLVPAVKGFG